MNRRHFLGTAPAIAAAHSAALHSAIGQQLPKIETASAVPGAATVARFFSVPQLAALRRLGDMVLPRIGETPGALDAGAPEFLDFLIGQSPLERRALYRSGLDALNTRAIDRFGIAFAALNDEQAGTLLTALHQPWTWDQPADVFALFLRAAKADILTATVNSREWIAVVSQRNRSAGGIGTYWLPAE